jgi:hypothetical protein
MAQVCPGEDAKECGEAVAPTPFGWWDTFNEHLYRNEADAARAIEGGNHVIALFVQAAQTSLHTEERGEFEKWFAESRELNPNCGCEQRGNRLFQCKYHEGAEDGWLARSRKG